MTKEDSHGLATRLQKRGRIVVTVDNRGSGDSDTPPNNLNMCDMAHDSIALMKSLQLHDNHFDMFGASMGGYIAQCTALMDVEETEKKTKSSCRPFLRKLILACTHHGGPKCHPPTAEYVALVNRCTPNYEDVDKWNQHMKELLSINFSNHFIEQCPKEFERLLEGAKDAERKSTLLRGRDGQMHAIQEYISVGVESGLKRIKIPTLIITGDCDRVVPPINSDLLHQTIKGSRKIVLNGVGHMFWEEMPEATADHVDTFL